MGFRVSSNKHIVIDARIRGSGVGAGRYVDRLLEHLQTIDTTNRYTVLVAPKDTWRPTAKNFSAKVSPFKRFSFNLLDQINHGRYLRRLKPDVVHFSMTPMEPMFYFGKRITTAHDLTMFNYVRAGGLPMVVHQTRMIGYRLLFWWSLRAANHVLVPTGFVKDDVIKHYPFTKYKTTVTLESSEPPLKATASPLKGVTAPFIFHVGSPLPHKNIEGLVEAFIKIKHEHPNLQLVLAGKREKYFQALEESIKSHPYRKDIIIPGFISEAELKWLYQNGTAYVMPSFSEGFGLPGLEAMVHGCPVVSSNATCLPEVFGNAAAYFDPHDTDDIAKVVGNVIANPTQRKELIKNGHARVKKFSWRRMAEETLETYRTVLG